MGKNKDSKYNKLGYFGKREADKRMAEQYGVDLSQYGNTGRPGGGGIQKKDWDQLSNDVANAAANDYDVRRSIELAQQSGNKKAQKIGSISNASEAYAATRFMEKTHKNRMENTGNYDGANDQGNVTKYWNDKANNFLMAKIDALSNYDDEQTNTAITPDTPEEPYEPSPELSKQAGILEDWEEGYGAGGNLSPYKSNFQDMAFNPEEANPYRPTTDVNEFAQQYAGDYKDNVKDIFQFRPTIA